MDKSRGSGQGLLRSPTSPPQSPLPSISAEGKVKVDKLIDQVDGIVLSDDTRAQNSFQMWLQEACKDGDTLKYAVERFHHYWLTDRPAVTKAGLFLCSNLKFEVDGQNLRQDLLLCLQKDFENRQEMQAKAPQTFLNAAAFLVEMYTHIRIEKLPLAFMITPVFQYLEDLLHGDDAEIELFAHLVISVGPTLKEAQQGDGHSSSLTSFDPLQKLFVKVRSVLMSRNLSTQSRLWLLFIMDASSSGDFELPSLPLQEFYRNKEQLGSSVDSLMKSLSLTPDQVKHDEDSSQNEIETAVEEKLSEIKISPKPKEKENTDKASNFGSKRSQGRNETFDKRESLRSVFQSEPKGQGKSYWLHDDRFDKEDPPARDRNSGNFSKPRVSQGNWKQSRDDRESKPRASDGDWRQPNRAQKGWDNGQTKTGESDAGSQGEDKWNKEQNVARSRVGDSNWKPPHSNRSQKVSQSKPDSVALAGHNCEEIWD